MGAPSPSKDRRPPLSAAPSGPLALLWPTPIETELLRACLWSGKRARAAWRRWRDTIPAGGDPIPGGHAARALLPLVHHAVHANRLDTDAALRAGLAMAALAEDRRRAAYDAIVARALAALATRSVAPLVLRGTALSATVYPAAARRHSHDIDLLVDPGDLDRAAAALAGAGFAADAPPGDGDRRALDATGLALELHTNLFRLPYHQLRLADVVARAQTIDAAGRRLRTLSPADHLAHVCGQAACSRRHHPLLWACDAWYLLAAGGAIEWDVLLDIAHRARLGIPLATTLAYLAGELDAVIPIAVQTELAAAAADADRTARHVALFGLRAGGRVRVRDLAAAARTGRDRRDVALWLLFPAPASIRGAGRTGGDFGCLAFYVRRPLAALARRMRTMNDPRQALRVARTTLLPAAAYMRQRYGIRHPALVLLSYPYRWVRGLRDTLRRA